MGKKGERVCSSAGKKINKKIKYLADFLRIRPQPPQGSEVQSGVLHCRSQILLEYDDFFVFFYSVMNTCSAQG